MVELDWLASMEKAHRRDQERRARRLGVKPDELYLSCGDCGHWLFSHDPSGCRCRIYATTKTIDCPCAGPVPLWPTTRVYAP